MLVLFLMFVFRRALWRVLRAAALAAFVALMILHPMDAWFVPGFVAAVVGVLGSIRPRDLRAPRADRTARTSVRG
jgi:hypothetical protein